MADDRLPHRRCRRISLRAAGLGAILAFASVAAPPARAAGIRVNSLADNEVVDSLCTLREAIKAVNSQAAYRGCAGGDGHGDTLFLPDGTIVLKATLPAMTAAMSILGRGYNQTIIEGAPAPSVGGIVVRSTVSMSNVSFRRFAGNALSIGASASLTLSSATVAGAGDRTSVGGCVDNAGSFTTVSVQFEACDGVRGGVLNNTGTAYLSQTTVLKSRTEHGLIWNTSSLTLQNVTIGPNHVGEGAGAVMNVGGSVQISDSTIAYNKTADSGVTSGGALNNSSGKMHLKNSVLFGNSGGARQCVGTITSDGFNAFDSASTCTTFATGDRSVSSALLQPLPGPEGGDFVNLPRAAGGVGRVYLPASNSPLLRQGGPDVCFFVDQRGIGRHLDGSCDIGAVERGHALLVVGNTTLSSGDNVLKAELESLGFVVTVVGDTASTKSDAKGKSVVVISGSVAGGNVNTKFRDVFVGVLVLEPSLLDDMNMTTATNLGTTNNLTTGRVTGPSASGFSGNTRLVNSSATFGWGTPADHAIRFVHAPGTNHHFGFAYLPITTMVNNFTAPAVRAYLFSTNATVPLLNAKGRRLLQEAMLWAAHHN